MDSQLSPCGHLAITHTPIIRTPAKSPAEINYINYIRNKRRLTEKIPAVAASRYSQLSPCEHVVITHTSLLRTAAKSPAKINYGRLTEINSRYFGLSLLRTLARDPAIKEVDCTEGPKKKQR